MGRTAHRRIIINIQENIVIGIVIVTKIIDAHGAQHGAMLADRKVLEQATVVKG
jgi:hypothetical protein